MSRQQRRANERNERLARKRVNNAIDTLVYYGVLEQKKKIKKVGDQ